MLDRPNFVSILFERGEFLAKDVEMTALALQYFSFGLPFMMLMKISEQVTNYGENFQIKPIKKA